MRATPLAFAIVLTLASGHGQAAAVPAPAGAKAEARSTWIVEFAEPPLATFRGDVTGTNPVLKGLEATSPAVTGKRRLDVDSLASREYRAVLAGLRAERLAAAQAKLGRVLVPGHEWDVTTHGVTLELSAGEAETLAKLPGVVRVQPEFVRELQTDSGPRWINADDVWAGTAGLPPNKGEGIVVGLIDSGVNRTHPAFAATGPVDGYIHQNPKGRLFGRCAAAINAAECNNKLIGIYDYSTGDESEEIDDGLDVSGHGTHVGSTAVGNTLNFTFSSGAATAQRQLSGVAPHGNLISYKACEQRTDGSTCLGTWLIAAINQATADGVDVINYSIGGASRNPWTSTDSLAMLAAREAGTVVVVAAGNDGANGAASVTAPGDAPWVLTAANATHDRAVVNKLTDLTGGATPPPGGGTLVGVGNTGPLPARALVFDPLFPKCSQGDGLDEAAAGASSPWPAGRFSGQIVVCERGVTARLAKSANVRLAGGAGMILVNTAEEAESVVADSHSIPAVHLGFSAGQALRDWLATGTGHQGRITGATLENSAVYGDILSASSGRGPSASVPGIVKPDLTAPGSDIIAAGTGTGAISRSGTSMATPHIAGAVALVMAGKPDWSPSKVESALMTTARTSVRQPDAATPATAFDAGAGTVDVAKALGAGLYFDVTPSDFRNANPAGGGSPRTLNRPSIAHEDCFETCTVSRRVTDLVGGGTWRVEFDFPDGVVATATPPQFTLAAGGSQIITFHFDVSDPRLSGTWVDGRVRFIRDTGTVQDIPVTLFASPGDLPASIAIGGPGESGFADVGFAGLVALPGASFIASDLATPVLESRTLPQDPTRDTPYGLFMDNQGVFYTTVTVPAGAGEPFVLRVRTLESTAYDIDLFVGLDLDGDGRPDADEEVCSSASAIDIESCVVEVAPQSVPQVYWIVVQNFDAGVQGDSDPAATDVVTVESLLIDPSEGTQGELIATGPGHVASGQPFTVRLAWNDPTLLPGERREGLLRLRTDDAAGATLGPIPVVVTRTAPGANAPALLAPDGTRHMRLAAGAAQDRLYLDVPDNAGSLTVSTAGSGEVDLYVARADAPSSPSIAAAPARGAAQATSIHPGATETLTVSGTALAPGRWYVTPVNAGTGVAEFDLTVALAGTQARPQPKYGAWYNPARSGAGVFLFPANGAWGLAWYTYLQDGTPTWYLGVGPAPGPNDGVWRVNLERFTWDGDDAEGTSVGQAQLELIDAERFTFSWNLDGESGSEPMGFLDGGACAPLGGVPAALTGLWYHPAKSGFGYSVNAYPGLESNGAYFYDGLGVARWALGQASPFGVETMVMQQRTNGFCPLCAHRVPTPTDIGTLARTYTSASTGNMAIDLELAPPLSGSWTVDLPVQRISDALVCP